MAKKKTKTTKVKKIRRSDDATWNRLSPRKKALANEGLYDY